MARKRYVSTEISTDSRVRKLAERSEFAAVLYTWMIPHAADDATIIADPDELLMLVVPGFRWRTADDVAEAIGQMVALGLLSYEGERLRFPPKAFYKAQSYIGADRRGQEPEPTPEPPSANGSADQRVSPQNSADKKFAPEAAQNSALARAHAQFPSSSSSSFPSSSSSSSSTATPAKTVRARAPTAAFTDDEQTQIDSIGQVLAPFGISADPLLWRKVLDSYGGLDLEAEALKQADWMRRHRIRACSSSRYLNWLSKARADALPTLEPEELAAMPPRPARTWLTCSKCGRQGYSEFTDPPLCSGCGDAATAANHRSAA